MTALFPFATKVNSLEQLCSEAIGDSQIVQSLCSPLTQFQQQRRELLPWRDHLLQQTDSLHNKTAAVRNV